MRSYFNRGNSVTISTTSLKGELHNFCVMNESWLLPISLSTRAFGGKQQPTSHCKAGACATRVPYSKFKNKCDRERDVSSLGLLTFCLNGSIEDTSHSPLFRFFLTCCEYALLSHKNSVSSTFLNSQTKQAHVNVNYLH